MLEEVIKICVKESYLSEWGRGKSMFGIKGLNVWSYAVCSWYNVLDVF